MKIKKYLFIGLLALICGLTGWTALSTGGNLFMGSLMGSASADNLDIMIEMPSSDNEDYSYKHPVMFRAAVKNPLQIKPLTPDSLNYVWESDRQGVIGNDMEFEKRLSKGKHLVTCRVSDGNGNKGKSQRYINVINTAPVVDIKSPREQITVKKGSMVNLEVDAADSEDGVVPDISIVWSCNIDGEFGRGKSIQTDTLSPGTHKITVTVKDSEGLEGKDFVIINVE